MKVVVTGANGFIGRAVVAALLTQGCSVTALVRNRSVGLARGSKQVVCGDLVELCAVSKGSEEITSWMHDTDIVVHTAARVHIMNDQSNDPYSEFRKINTIATLDLAQRAADAGVKRFIFMSTIKVNGEHTLPNTPFREKVDYPPTDPYALSKSEAEQGLKNIAHQTGMEVVIIRPPLVYGPGVKGNFSTMIKWINRGIPMPFGAVDNQRSFLALDNLVSFIQVCLEHPKAANQIFVLADGEDVSTSQLLKKIAKVMKKRVFLISVPVTWMTFVARLLGKQAVIERLLSSLQIDNSKAIELLGWRPKVSMEEQLVKMLPK